jgi:hydrogenase nickel incorporation protein HypA/HybF
MHELGICEAVLERVQERAAGRRVEGVGLRAGAGLRLVSGAVQQSFDLLTVGTTAEGAVVDLDVVPGRGTCQECEAAFEAEALLAACPSCGSVAVEVQGADDLVVTWLRFVETEGG